MGVESKWQGERVLAAASRLASGVVTDPVRIDHAKQVLGEDLTRTAAAIGKLQGQFAEAQQQAITDPLTGLYNRRYMGEALTREVGRARRFGHPLAMVMMDIDHFKIVNDTYGHISGDKVLQEIGRRCLGCVREIDIVFRYGGEEFLIVLPETGPESMLVFTERLRRCVSDEVVRLSDKQNVVVTISLGAAQWQGEDAESFVDHADKALYVAKGAENDGGRNRTAVYEGGGQIRIHQPVSTPGVE